MDSLPFLTWFWLYVPVAFFIVAGFVTYFVERRRDHK